MNYWLLKTEPGTYSWDDLVKAGKAVWDGVHNFQARKNLKAMKKGDVVFFYHTGDEKSVIGIATISREAYPDPKEKEWVVVEVTPKKKLKSAVSLATIRGEKALTGMVLVRVARLSVQPVTEKEFQHIVSLSEKK